jgi:succinoglycan biosynthesis transport protein ExoP
LQDGSRPGVRMPDELDGHVFLSLEDFWAIALRRRWWILLSMFLAWSAVWGVSWLLPSTYKSEALILMEQQKFPDQSVVPNASTNPQQRVQTVTEQILSRTRLQATIDRFHLYPPNHGLNGLLKSGDPIAQMRNDIKIDIADTPGRPGEFSAFKIGYSAESPQLARDVNAELTTIFIEENVKAQRRLSEDTTNFQENELAKARANMAAQAAKVAAFEARHLGDLPSQVATNVQILSGIQSQLQNTQQALDAARQQKLYLESLLQQYQSVQARKHNSEGPSAATRVQALDKQLLHERARLNVLESRYTESFPDIVALKVTIAETEQLKTQAENEMAVNPQAVNTPNTIDPSAAEELQGGTPIPLAQVQSRLKANESEILNGQQHKKDLESKIAEYQTRLNLAPTTEQELAIISREYEESKANYNSLQQKEMQSQLATSLAQRQQADQFRIVDPPSLPKKPSAPNHLLFSLAGLIAGISLGLGLASFLELVDVRIRQEKDLEGIIPVRVLVGIPRLNTRKDKYFRALRWCTELAAAMTLILLIVLGNLYDFYKG